MNRRSFLFLASFLGMPSLRAQGNAPDLTLSGSVTAADERLLRSMVEPAARRLSAGLRIPWSRPLRIEVYRTERELPQELEGSFGTHTAAVTLLGRDRIILLSDRSERPPNELKTVLEHELVHAILDQLPPDAARKIPRWLHEGYAQSWSERIHGGGSVDEVAFHAAIGGLPSFRKLAEDFSKDAAAVRLAYAQSFSFVAFLRRRLGDETLVRCVRALADARDFDEAFAKTIGSSLLVEEAAWMEDLRHGGATFRFLQDNCFLYLMLIATPIAFLALARKVRRDSAARKAMEDADDLEDLDGMQEQELEEDEEPPAFDDADATPPPPGRGGPT